MAIVRAFSVEGLKLWFYSNDHEPPHFHAKRIGEWEVKVHFLESREQMIEAAADGTLPLAKTQKLLTKLAEETGSRFSPNGKRSISIDRDL